MKILAVDQARHCGWAVFDYDTKVLESYGSLQFDNSHFTFEQCLFDLPNAVRNLMDTHSCCATFIEDIQLQISALSFKRLAQLQGAFLYTFKRDEILYDLISPSQWQNYCGARGRSTKEIKKKMTTVPTNGKKQSKIFSMQFVKNQFGVDLEDDNIADAICIGWYVVNNIRIKGVDSYGNDGKKC